jgi:hypothetical protein
MEISYSSMLEKDKIPVPEAKYNVGTVLMRIRVKTRRVRSSHVEAPASIEAAMLDQIAASILWDGSMVNHGVSSCSLTCSHAWHSALWHAEPECMHAAPAPFHAAVHDWAGAPTI